MTRPRFFSTSSARAVSVLEGASRRRSTAVGRAVASMLTVLLAAPLLVLSPAGAAVTPKITRPPQNASFDYQIGGDYTPRSGIKVVSRDWFTGAALKGTGTYSICYVNAFQTQDDEDDVDRRDEKSAWPTALVLTSLGDDPNWGGEYLIDISTAAKRQQALAWLKPIVDTCARKGFKAVEFDNLDSWTRFEGTPVASRVPFGKTEAIAFAELLTDYAHGRGLAVGQKNTPQLTKAQARTTIGFDFAVAEECGRYDECSDYTAVYGNQVYVIEYNDKGFTKACRSVGAKVSVVRRDVSVSTPGSRGYVHATC